MTKKPEEPVQEEMIPRTAHEAVIALRQHVENEMQTEDENYKKRSVVHKERMGHFKRQLDNVQLMEDAIKAGD
jgi:hypothetical protein